MKPKKKKRMGLCKDKRLFMNLLKQELSLNVAKEGVKVTLKSRLKEDLDIDSLEAIEMLLDLEDKYNVEIDNTLMDFNEIKTVGDLRDFLYDKTLFPEDIAVRDKEAKEKAKKLKNDRAKIEKELETVSIFENEYDDYAPPPQIDAEKEMQKIEEEESKAKKGLRLPKGGKQVE